MIKGIVFDADGMIVHGERFSSRLQKAYGISTDVTGDFFKGGFQDCLVGKADLKEVLPKQFEKWGWRGTLEELLAFWFDPSANHVDERFGAVVKNLRERGIYCCLATNNERYRTEDLMKKRGIGEWFDAVFSSWEVGSKKPEKKFFEKISAASGIPIAELQFWDDDIENVNGAKEAGLETKTFTTFEDFLKEAGL